jgi:hypothetical protein
MGSEDWTKDRNVAEETVKGRGEWERSLDGTTLKFIVIMFLSRFMVQWVFEGEIKSEVAWKALSLMEGNTAPDGPTKTLDLQEAEVILERPN